MVLITGASGFLGQHLLRHLAAQGLRIRALFHSHPPLADLRNIPGVEWLQCDLLDVFAVEEAMQGVTDVYHCAAIVSFDSKARNSMLHFNTQSTANVVNESLLQGIRKLVHVSSVAAIGRSGDAAKEITEEEEWGESSYNSAYAISKYFAETEVWRGMGEGLNAVIVNPGIILGAGDWHKGSAQLMKVAYDEFPFYTSGSTSWVDVADVVKILDLLMKSDIAGQRFILSSGNHSFREVFTSMAGALNKKPPRYRANALVTGIAWRAGKLRNMLFGTNMAITRETAITAHSSSFYSNSKLLAALPGFTYTSIHSSINLMARSFLESYSDAKK
jgi:dihydroflavonol-4-reductase